MRRHVPAVLLLPFAVLLTGCHDPVQPTDVTVPSAALTAVDPLGKVHPLPADLEQKVQRFRADLEARGYEVTRGYFTLWGAEECKYPLHTVGFCYGNNPTAPYVFAVVPQWNDEFVDQRLHHAVLAARRNMSATYRLDEQEALVVLAEMPPPARYFSIATNVFSRETTLNPTEPIYVRVAGLPTLQKILFSASPNPDRPMMLASIGNSTNNVVMERQSGSPWLKQRHFVITSDAGIADAMTAALLRAGVPSANDVFTERVAPALVRVGLGREKDDLFTYVRYALPIDSVAGEAWRATLPLTILRVRAATGAGPTQPFSIPAYDQRTWNRNEPAELKDDLDALSDAVRVRWGQPSAQVASSISAYMFLDLVGQHCLGVGSPLPNRGPMNCLADNQDTDYQITVPPLHIDNGEVIAAVGTLATATGNATYVSLGVNRFPALVGVANLSDADLYLTAASFQGALQHDHRLFYVYYLARDCTGLHPCQEISRKLFPVGETFKLMQRNYINPGSTVGPHPEKVLNPIAVVLDGRARPSSP
jgi:hypothetical protein